MNIPKKAQMKKLLQKELDKKEEADTYVELGENWEFIAEVFYKLGFEDGAK